MVWLTLCSLAMRHNARKDWASNEPQMRNAIIEDVRVAGGGGG